MNAPRSWVPRLASHSIIALACLSMAMAGCVVYDESLLSVDTEGEEEAHGGHGSEGEELELADECDEQSEPLPILDSSEGHRVVTTVMHVDNERLFPTCGFDATLAGPDVFFKIEVEAGDRWHFALTPEDPAVDLATVILDSCDIQTCRNVLDLCGAGVPEEYTQVATAPATWVVGIDSHEAEVGSEIELIVQRTACGDGLQEHGEPCDDGNTIAGDGCDGLCRIELAGDPAAEIEPNNGPMEGNVAAFPAASSTHHLTGKLGGPCDADVFVFTVPAETSFSATMLTAGSQPCAPDHAPVRMRLIRADTGSVLGTAASGRAGGTCPSMELGDGFNENLAAGEYHLELIAPDAPPSFDYLVQVVLSG